jgi:hypothetical protein
LFGESYDEPNFRVVAEYVDVQSGKVYREINYGAASIVRSWVIDKISWEALVEMHSSKFFSAGDCMMVLFRFGTYLQSCARLSEIDENLASQARALHKTLMREPLDARHKMLLEEAENTKNEESLIPVSEIE